MNDTTETTPNTSALVKQIEMLAVNGLSDFDAQLADFKKRYANVVYDLTDRTVEQGARSDRAAVSRVIANVGRRHKILKEPLLKAAREVDSRRRALKTGLEAIRDGIGAQLDAHAQIEIDRKAAIDARVQAIRDMTVVTNLSADEIGVVLLELDDIEIDDSWQEFAADAEIARDDTRDALRLVLDAARRREAEQAELAKLRAEADARAVEDAARATREREERIAREAAEAGRREVEAKKERAIVAARLEAEAAAQAAKDAETARQAAVLAAEREAQETTAREERAASEWLERERVARERAERETAEAAERAERNARERELRAARDAAEAAKRDAELERQRIDNETTARLRAERRAAEEERVRKAHAEHRQRIHREAMDALIAHDIDETLARRVVELVRAGDVAHVRIDY